MSLNVSQAELSYLINNTKHDVSLRIIVNKLLVSLKEKQNTINRILYTCLDCKQNAKEMGETAFMLKGEIWHEAIGELYLGVCCIGCIEKRLKRELTRDDFNWKVPLNNLNFRRSDRLKNRMGI